MKTSGTTTRGGSALIYMPIVFSVIVYLLALVGNAAFD